MARTVAVLGISATLSLTTAFVPAPPGVTDPGLPDYVAPKPKPRPKPTPLAVEPSPVVSQPSPAPSSNSLSNIESSSGIEGTICSFGWDCATALAVARCESGLNPAAASGRFFGIFQLGDTERATYGGSSLDPYEQIAAAYRYYLVSRWEPWSCAA